MRHVFVALTILLCCAFATAGVGQANAPIKDLSPFEQKLIALEKTFIEAEKKGDVEYFKRTFTEDFSEVSYDGQLYGRQEALGDLSEGGSELTPYNFKVLPIGEDSALVTYDAILRVPAEEDQGPPPRYQHISSVWVKQAEQWKMKFRQMTPTHWGDW
jgi:hypothetical protein